jgi:hypothetical protein
VSSPTERPPVVMPAIIPAGLYYDLLEERGHPQPYLGPCQVETSKLEAWLPRSASVDLAHSRK